MTPAEIVAQGKNRKPYDTECERVRPAWAIKLRDLRRRLSLSMKDIRIHCGIPVSTYCHIEKGRVPSLIVAMRLARFYGTTVEQVWGEHKEVDNGIE